MVELHPGVIVIVSRARGVPYLGVLQPNVQRGSNAGTAPETRVVAAAAA